MAAAARYKVPWQLLAGIGMAETRHGRNNTTSSAGAQGLMQFMPGTFAAYGVDGNGDGSEADPQRRRHDLLRRPLPGRLRGQEPAQPG